MIHFKKKGAFIIIALTILFVFIRSIHFKEFLNFSFDQGWGATRILEIWKNKELTLVGPGTSITAHGKQILQGSVLYYLNLVFLLLGNFDPIRSSYAFMLFCALMLIPLYFGVKLLFNNKVALLIVIFYALFPYFIDFTRFFFGPNFQLSLMPLLILFLGLYKQKQKSVYLFLIFFFSGFLTQFHYQFIIITVVLFIYFFLKSNKKLKYLFISSLGFIIGFLPMIIFELKNSFYNFKVLSEYLQLPKKGTDLTFVPHRYLSLSLILLIIIAGYLKKYLTDIFLITFASILLVTDLVLYVPKPKQAYGMAKNWNYLMEEKAYSIIRNENINNINIVNLAYDNLSVVIKYLLKKDGYKTDYDDYYHNDYLFIISHDNNIFNNLAYEVNTFRPNEKIKKWKLNDYYSLYLFKRVQKQ